MSGAGRSEIGSITFETEPKAYRHWSLTVDGRIATLRMDVDEDAALAPGYKLKLNSYDLGVDIELNDALQRIRFEHPSVACVVITSAKSRMFCSGANIYMLGSSSHAWKVNFCKFTNETRNGMEDSSAHDGLAFIAAINGACAGGGYELALACDEILMVDDRSSTVSLPEAPLLGVLPGTGGLTRLVDKRNVRRDLADLFCANADGVRAERAKAWGLVDAIAPPHQFAALIDAACARFVEASPRDAHATGVPLTPLERRVDDAAIHYRYVDIAPDRTSRTASITVRAPQEAPPRDLESIVAAGGNWWPLAMARELDDAILMLRTNERELGLWLFRTEGDASAVLEVGAALSQHRNHWLVHETIGLLRRTLARLDVTSRSLYALVEPGSCFVGVLLELALAADRTYMLDLAGAADEPAIALDESNFGMLPTVNGLSRLQQRFHGRDSEVQRAAAARGARLGAAAAQELGLVTLAPDRLDWDEEIRLAIEERARVSPDALTGLEANLRFPGQETLHSKIFARLSAWQNWVFYRPNATGDRGALRVFGTGAKASFDWERV